MVLLLVLLSVASLALQANSKCTGPIDLIFAVDSSGSLGQDGYDKQINMLSDIVRSFKVDTANTQIGAVAYGYSGERLFDLMDRKSSESVIQAFSEAPYRGSSSNLHRALNVIRYDNMFSPNETRWFAPDVVVVVLSDMTNRPQRSIDAALALRHMGVRVYTIVFNTSLETLYVSKSISSHYQMPLNYQEYNQSLYGTTDSVVERLCQLAGGTMVNGTNGTATERIMIPG